MRLTSLSRLLLLCLGLWPAAGLAQSVEPAARPRIGLVLSGGGARGTAHIGVLKKLDEMHIPIDAIAGTSMGAVIGGLYASGLSGLEIEKLLSSVDWQDAFRDKPKRTDLAFRRKREDEDFLVNLPLGVRGKKLLIPSGLIAGQKLTQILRQATLPVATIDDFDQLTPQLRVVATDLETGAAVVMGSGDLTSALRASVSAPGAFAPVERDGRLLVDGGLVKNLPIDVARGMGVDVLIVVDAGVLLQTRERLNSLPSVSNQALAIMVRRDADVQRATLTSRDVLLVPELNDVSSYDFGVLERAIYAGADAAERSRQSLQALSVSQPEYDRYVAARHAAHDGLPVVQFVRAESTTNTYRRQITDLFSDLAGKPLDPKEAERRVTTLYGRGDLETLDYRLVRENESEGLEVSAHPNSWGPNYLRLGLSLQDDFAGNSTFNAAGRLLFTELNSLGAESVWDLQVGSSLRLATELYLPLSNRVRYFFAPHVEVEAHNVPQLAPQPPQPAPQVVDRQQIGELRVRTFNYGLDAGREFSNWGEVRAGLLRSEGKTSVRIGDFSIPDSTFGVNAGFLRLSYDHLDSANFPHSGQALRAEWRVEGDGRAERGSDLLTLDWRGAFSFGQNTLVGWVSGGSTIGGSQSNVRSLFPLGGFLNLSGLRAQSLTGPQYGIARAIYLRKVGSGGEGVLNVPGYAGVAIETGNVWSDRSEVRLSGLRRDAAVFFGADTYIGPAYLAFGYDDGSRDTAFYLFLGRSF
jgi:NTE family protein